MLSLESFISRFGDEFIRISSPVPLEAVGALTAQAETTILFESIEGYPGFRLVDQLFVNRRAQARVLDCAPAEVVARLAAVLRAGPKPLHVVGDAPCQERVLIGGDINLALLPIVTHTDHDPYPYTTSFAIHRDPVSGELNQMYPRCGVLDRNHMVASFVTPTANRFLAAHRADGTKMPQAVVIGPHPGWELAGCYSGPHEGWSELELFESITGERADVVQCKTVDLVVPADASIVIEGYIDPGRKAQDGPSPGPSMLFTPYATQQPVFEVTAITMREQPIYRNHQMTPFTDHQEMPRLFHEAIIHEIVRAQGLKVLDVHFPQGGGALSCVLQVAPTAEGQVSDALLATLGAPWLNTKMVVAVDEDIDIYDYRDLYYALATRVDPARDVVTIERGRGNPFDPSAIPVVAASPETRDSRFPSVVGKWGIDATKPVPYEGERRARFERAWPKRWGEFRLEDFLIDAETTRELAP